jgi:succinate dehydrogenase hydrophobic anchor subunit
MLYTAHFRDKKKYENTQVVDRWTKKIIFYKNSTNDSCLEWLTCTSLIICMLPHIYIMCTQKRVCKERWVRKLVSSEIDKQAMHLLLIIAAHVIYFIHTWIPVFFTHSDLFILERDMCTKI